MITQAQAHATAARWLNPEGHQGPPREVAMQEFDLGWVVWAVPPPPEVDPRTGQRRPPAEVGAACGVVDRASGELTVWPSVPVDEVVRMYRQKHGAGSGAAPAAPAERPVTGPGNTAVATYNDPSTGEETSLARVSGPGQPPAEYQLHDELRRLGVNPADVRAVHTDLRSALLPGGYPGDFILRTFSNATFSCTEGYGMRPEERAEGIAGLVRHVEMMHQLAGHGCRRDRTGCRCRSRSSPRRRCGTWRSASTWWRSSGRRASAARTPTISPRPSCPRPRGTL